jgi:Kelch motif/Galactose oxidase, central domain
MKTAIKVWSSLLLLGVLVPCAAAQSWTPNGPLPRFSHSAVFDPSTKQMIVFGGLSGYGGQIFDADVWRLLPSASLAGVQNWVALHTTGTAPAARGAHVAGYDPASNRMVVFGGQTADGCVNDVWVLTNANGSGGLAAWSQLTPVGGPPESRERFGSAYDPVSNTLMVYGGFDCQTSAVLNDYWVLSNANGVSGTPTWTELPTGLGGPSPRYGQTAVYDPTTNELIVYGGTNGQYHSIYGDIWVISDANGTGGYPGWQQVFPVGDPPQGREVHSATYDPVTNVMTIYGGYGSSGSTLGDAWVLTHANNMGGTPVWTQVAENSTVFAARRTEHTAVYDASRNVMIVFGGGVSAATNDVFLLSDANGH